MRPFTFASKSHCGHSPRTSKSEWPHSLPETLPVVERNNSRESRQGLVEKYTSIEAEGSLAYSPQPTEGLAMQVVSSPLKERGPNDRTGP